MYVLILFATFVHIFFIMVPRIIIMKIPKKHTCSKKKMSSTSKVMGHLNNICSHDKLFSLMFSSFTLVIL